MHGVQLCYIYIYIYYTAQYVPAGRIPADAPAGDGGAFSRQVRPIDHITNTMHPRRADDADTAAAVSANLSYSALYIHIYIYIDIYVTSNNNNIIIFSSRVHTWEIAETERS
jgi:hypothetical protein